MKLNGEDIKLFGLNGQFVNLKLEIDEQPTLEYQYDDSEYQEIIYYERGDNLKCNMKHWKHVYTLLGLKCITYSDLLRILRSIFEDGKQRNAASYYHFMKQFSNCIKFYLEYDFEVEDKIEEIDIEQLDIESELGYNHGKKLLLERPYLFQDAPERFKVDRELIIELATIDSSILKFVPDPIKDETMFHQCISDCDVSAALYFPEQYYITDETISKQDLLDYVSNNPHTFKDAPLFIRDNEEHVKLILCDSPKLFRNISPRLKQNIECIRLSFLTQHSILDNLKPEAYLDDTAIQSQIVTQLEKKPWGAMDLLKYSNEATRSNSALFIKLVAKSDKCMNYASEALCKDKQFFMKVSKLALNPIYHESILVRASLDILLDKSLMARFVTRKGDFVFKKVSEIHSNNLEFHKMLIEINPRLRAQFHYKALQNAAIAEYLKERKV
jgi:hypothetical protein